MSTKEDILNMDEKKMIDDEEMIDDIAFNAGCYKHKYCNPAHPDLEGWIINQDSLERFASLIIAAEREACAKTAEELMQQALDALVWEAGSEPALYAAQTYAAIADLGERLVQPTSDGYF